MYYIIKRETDMMFETATNSFNINDEIYDVVENSKNSGLDSISDFIVDDNNALIKSNPRIEKTFREQFEKETNTRLKELLLG